MTISKKLFIIGALVIGLQPIAHAYNVVGLKEEISLISDFAEKNSDYVEYEGYHINIGNWLNEKINSTYMTSDLTIITIANIIKQDNATATLLAKIKCERAEADCLAMMASGLLVGIYVYGILKHLIRLEIMHSERESAKLIDKLRQQINTMNKPKTTATNKWFSPNLFV
jgi:hypothetical protein